MKRDSTILNDENETAMVRRGIVDYSVLHLEMVQRLYAGKNLTLLDLGEILEDGANRLLDIADRIREYVISTQASVRIASQLSLEQKSQKTGSADKQHSTRQRTKNSSR